MLYISLLLILLVCIAIWILVLCIENRAFNARQEKLLNAISERFFLEHEQFWK